MKTLLPMIWKFNGYMSLALSEAPFLQLTEAPGCYEMGCTISSNWLLFPDKSAYMMIWYVINNNNNNNNDKITKITITIAWTGQDKFLS